MRRFAQLRSSLLASRTCRPFASHSPSRLYTTKNETIDTRTTAKDQDETEFETESETMVDIESFDFGFDNWSEVNPETKTIQTVAGSLPISPILDPAWRKARQRKKGKLPPNKNKFNRFQRRVEGNPYAQLLAEPVRSCDLTRTYLPNSFIQKFGLVKHPESGDPWWIPGDFEPPSGKSTTNASDETEFAYLAADGVAVPDDSATAKNDEVATLNPAESQEEPMARQARKFFAPAHMLARQDMLLEFFVGKSYYDRAWMRFASNPRIGRRGGAATWRQDMHEVIRDQLRRQIVQELIYLARLCTEKDRNYLVKVDSDENLKGYEQHRFCYLQLDEGRREPFGVLEIDGVEDSARPVYNLPALLSPESVQHLASEASLFRDPPMLLVRGERTVELNKKLWRLQGFLAEY